MIHQKLIEDAYQDLFGDDCPYQLDVVYTKRFKPYNANIKRRGDDITVQLSEKWRRVSREIQIGIIQELLAKILKKKVKKTTNMELYAHFMKHIHVAAPKIHSDPLLQASFDRMNDEYFAGMLEQTNLKWGTASTRKLGHYEYGSDTIVMSTIFKQSPERLLDYVMYHEMLHKKFKFDCKNSRTHYHTPQFKAMEKRYPSFDTVDHELNVFIRSIKQKDKKWWELS